MWCMVGVPQTQLKHPGRESMTFRSPRPSTSLHLSPLVTAGLIYTFTVSLQVLFGPVTATVLLVLGMKYMCYDSLLNACV